MRFRCRDNDSTAEKTPTNQPLETPQYILRFDGQVFKWYQSCAELNK